MSIAGFRATNHPQQTSKRGAADATDDRGTDIVFYRDTSARFGGFTLDVAAAEHNAKCDDYYTVNDDGLSLPWRGRVWCNPPYSDCGAWVRKAWNEWLVAGDWWLEQVASGQLAYNVHGGSTRKNTTSIIVMLLPANRVEQAWWQDLVEPHRDRPGSPLRVEFLRGRMRFDRPNWQPGPKGDRPPFGCCLLIWSDPA